MSFLPSESSLTRHHSAVGLVMMHVSISRTPNKEKREGEEFHMTRTREPGARADYASQLARRLEAYGQLII